MQGNINQNDYSKDFSSYLLQKGTSRATNRSYIFDTRQFIAWLVENDIDIAHVGRDEAQRYISFLISQQYLSSTIQKKMCSLRKFFEWLEVVNG